MLAFDLARRRRIAFFRIKLFRNDPEFLYLFDARQAFVDGGDLAFDQLDDGVVRGQRCEAGVDYIVASRPVGNRAEIDLDKRADEFAPVADQRSLADVGTALEQVLDFARRDVFAAARN